MVSLDKIFPQAKMLISLKEKINSAFILKSNKLSVLKILSNNYNHPLIISADIMFTLKAFQMFYIE